MSSNVRVYRSAMSIGVGRATARRGRPDPVPGSSIPPERPPKLTQSSSTTSPRTTIGTSITTRSPQEVDGLVLELLGRGAGDAIVTLLLAVALDLRCDVGVVRPHPQGSN